VPDRLRLPAVAHFDRTWNRQHRPRISGAFVGTTDEIIQWAACKWGLSDELLRAQAVVESGWVQAARGDYERRSEGVCTVHDRGDPCPTSFGLLQNKWYFNRPAYPQLRGMTAFHMDWSAAQLRGCYDGHKGFPAGDFWGCVGNWFSGEWDDRGARDYVARVRAELAAKRWLRWADRGGRLPYDTRLVGRA
jgi:autotransporter family porin